ncbi:MAG: three-Cys-motif partner protein TcmP [Candidatus Heimdallarchaeota archaeon]|nr:three-Cys-motif partner protein TcmP [Candidatus Heimdallarchaeota archaeon]
MGLLSKDGFDWLAGKASYLFRDVDNLCKIEPETYGNVKSLSFLKLIALGYILPMYTDIIGKQRDKGDYIKQMVYIDLFAGSGLNKVEHNEKSHFLLGSPFIAIHSTKKPFDKMIFVEQDKDLSNALKKRLSGKSKQQDFKWLANRYQCLTGDQNVIVRQIISKLEPKTHCFIFLDPFSTELNWLTLNYISRNTRSDIFINIMSTEIFRGISSARKTGSLKLDSWFGNNSWTQIKNRTEIVSAYSKKVINLPDSGKAKREVFELLPINALEKLKREPYYYLLFAARKTKGGNRWIEAVRKVQDYLQDATDEDIKAILDKLFESQSSLNDWY